MAELVLVRLTPRADGRPYSCSCCGQEFVYGTKSSWLSLLPFVCRHPVADFSVRPRFLEEVEAAELVEWDGPYKNAAGRPGYRPGRVKVAWDNVRFKVTHPLYARLVDQLKGRRWRWYTPLTAQALEDDCRAEEKRRIRQRARADGDVIGPR